MNKQYSKQAIFENNPMFRPLFSPRAYLGRGWLRVYSSAFFSAVIAAFLSLCSPCFFKHSRDTAANKAFHVSTLYSLLYRPDASSRVFLPRSPSDRRGRLDVIRGLFSYRVLIALGLFRRKLPIKHVNSECLHVFDLIFSSSSQWSRNALMQIVAIAPWCGELPRRDHYKRFNPLALSLGVPLFPFACPNRPVLFPAISLALFVSPSRSSKIDSPEGVARQA